MAFTLTATQGSDSLTLTSLPYSLLRATGMGGAAVRRVTTQGPKQHGDSDKGYRLLPRRFELQIGVKAATDALLDGYRDALVSLFKPLDDDPVQLQVTRDDGEVRALDCYLDGEIEIALVPGLRPGHYHRVTLPLVAPEPAYYGIAPGTATVTGTVNLANQWWLAGGAIGTAQVLMSGGTPGSNATWAYAGTIIGTATHYEIAIRAGSVSPAGAKASLFEGGIGMAKFYRQTDTAGGDAGNPRYRFGGNSKVTNGMIAGTQNYFYVNLGLFAPVPDLTPGYRKWITPVGTTTIEYNSNIVGTAMRWRTDSWPGTIQLYALYSPSLNEPQRSALSVYMAGTPGTVSQVVNVPYAGDLPEYPVISIRGPLTGASIVNTATGDALDFGTIAIGAGTTYVIDTRYGAKTVLAGTANKRGELTPDSDLGTWALVPDPIAAGGTNSIAVYGTGTGTATQVSIVYYNRFASM